MNWWVESYIDVIHITLPRVGVQVIRSGIEVDVVACVNERLALLDELVRGDLAIDQSLEVLQSLNLVLFRRVFVKLYGDAGLPSCVIEEDTDLDVICGLQESGLSLSRPLLGPVELDVER